MTYDSQSGRERTLARILKRLEESPVRRPYCIGEAEELKAIRFDPTPQDEVGYLAIIADDWVDLQAEWAPASDSGDLPPQKIAWQSSPPCDSFRNPAAIEEIVDLIVTVATHPTRFRQEKGWILWSFLLECRDGAMWRRLGAVHHLKWAFRAYGMVPSGG